MQPRDHLPGSGTAPIALDGPHDSVDRLRPGGTPRAGAGRPDGPRPVVVGVDASPESRRALDWAIAYAARTAGELRVITAWQTPVAFGAAPIPPPDPGDAEQAARHILGEATETIRSEGADLSAVRTHLQEGDAAKVLLDHSSDAGLLVLGNRRRSAIGGAFLGSTAQYCVQHATCPVVLVPEPM
ncbi:universal stress protein [Pseudonocardia sp. KRD-184]|uniref:Universal stress protein n=2 Tax=Pseudonocardia oceani TaxID=2792013 RepID=A0ABS6U9S6_9PSEU|nr:universal stress protein [Pseudonocardia oceani]MBW0089088.1 universal stress protein [Pseudonocardia oceani]MBW0096001.1 universal stress protein [Pseudonocardia oceani]MBW0108726.1 universal stress protein [Pseudonocardia oceani]MBW0121404.1 universal stress protein [Pseudonocardia oceani]MBW0128728.1 universal stress protein [Pseudonocardia oceani]